MKYATFHMEKAIIFQSFTLFFLNSDIESFHIDLCVTAEHALIPWFPLAALQFLALEFHSNHKTIWMLPKTLCFPRRAGYLKIFFENTVMQSSVLPV